MEELEFPASAAGGGAAVAAVDQHHAGFGDRHEIQSGPQNSSNGRLLRSGHTVLRGLVRDAPPARSRSGSRTTLTIATISRATWCTPIRNRSRRYTTTWPRSSTRPITSANNLPVGDGVRQPCAGRVPCGVEFWAAHAARVSISAASRNELLIRFEEISWPILMLSRNQRCGGL